MNTTPSRADSFVRAFAEGLVNRAGLQLEPEARKRTVEELERSVHQRLGVAAFERLGEERIQEVVKDFLQGAPSQQLTDMLQQPNAANTFIEDELKTLATEFLQAVHTT